MRIDEFKLERYFAKYEFETPYILGASDCETFSVNELLDLDYESYDQLKKLKLGYTESLGHPVLREEVSCLYEEIEPDNIVIFSGAEEGIFILMNVLLEKGDHVIVQYPCYQSLFEIANAIGCQITKWEMDPRDWSLNLEFLKKSINSRTKLIIVNFPHNPTGMLVTNQIYRSIIEVAKDNDIYLLSDEVYRFLEYDATDRLPSACDLYAKALSLGVLSKAFGLAGLRIGWIATKDEKLLKDIATFKDYTTICNSALSEFFAILAIRNRSYLLNRNLKIVKTNLKYLKQFFKRNEEIFYFIPPTGGSIAFPSLKSNGYSTDFCQMLIESKRVLLIPSTMFLYGNKHFRIGFGRRDFPVGLTKLEEFIKESPFK